ncbi:elongation factor P, partial [archaeon]
MATTSDLRKGITIKLEGDLYTVVDFQHVKMGRGGAFVRTRLKNLKTGVVLERTFKAGDKIDIVHLEEKSFQYIYREGDTFYFMDMETYDQLPLSIEVVGEARNYLTENMEVNIIYADGEP